MKFKIYIFAVFLFTMGLIAEEKPMIVMIPFQSTSRDFSKEILESYSEYLKTKLNNKQLYTFVDNTEAAKRQKLKMIEEQQLGLIDEKNSIIKIGKDLQAQKVLAGNIYNAAEGYRISIKVIDINLGKEDFSGAKTSADKSETAIETTIDKLVEDLDSKFHGGKRLTKTDILWRSALLPGYGQFASGIALNENPKIVKGGVMIGLGVLLFANLYSSDVAYKNAKSAHDTANSIHLLASLSGQYTNTLGFATFFYANNERANMDSSASRAQGASLLFVAYYLYNLVDAYYFSGGTSSAFMEPKNRFQIASRNENYFGVKNLQTDMYYQFRF